MFSPLFRSTTPTDGPARGATQGQRHAPDSMRSDDEAARALGSPPSTNQGAHNDQSTVQQNRSLRAELSASSPLRLPEGSLQKAAQAAAALAARLLETKHVPGHVPAVLTLLNNIKAGEADPQVVFPGIDDDAQKLTMRINLEHALEVSRDGDELLELVMHIPSLSPPKPTTSDRSMTTPPFLRTPPAPGIEEAYSKLEIISNTRRLLGTRTPRWFFNKDAPSSMIIPLPPWVSVVNSSPSSNKDSNTAMTAGVMKQLVSSSIKDGRESGEYAKNRSALLAGVGSNYCAAVFSVTNSGMSFEDALSVGHRKAIDTVLLALQSITFVDGPATLARRGAADTGSVELVLYQLIVSLDDTLLPNESDQYLKWHTLAPTTGETARLFLMRLQSNAASLGRSDEDIVNQFRMGLDQVVKLHGSTTAQSVRSETRRCTTTMELNKERASNPHLHDQPLFVATAKGPTTRTSTPLATSPPGVPVETAGSDATTLATNRPLRPSFDAANATRMAMDLYGPDGIPPIIPIAPFGSPPVRWAKCVFCYLLKIQLVPFDAEHPLPGAGKANEHNVWRCPRAERAADQVIADHPSVKREDFLRPIDNLSHQVCVECISAARL